MIMRQNIYFLPYSRRSIWKASSSCNSLSGRILNKMENEKMHDTPICDVDNIKFNFVATESQIVHTRGEIMLSENSIVVTEEIVDNQDSEVVVNDDTNISPSTKDQLQCTKSDCSEVSSTSNHLEETAPSRKTKVLAKHPCTYPGCKAVFSRPWRLAAHKSKHTGHKPFACPIEGCDKKYGSPSHLKRHTDDVHCGRRRIITEYSCPEEKCTKVFRSTQSVKRHYKLHHPEKASDSLKCQSCNTIFSSMECLEIHNRVEKCQGALRECPKLENARARKKKEYCCSESECNKVFPNSLLLRKHMKSEHNSCSEVICYICDKKFASKTYLRCHLTTHLSSHQRKQFQCPYEDCTRHYTTKFNLQQHISSKHEGKKFTCMYEECMEKKFATKQKLQEHLKRHLLPPCPKVKETTARRKRKDTGLPKRSMAVKLSGVQVPYHIEKSVLNLDLLQKSDEKELSVLDLDPSDECDDSEHSDEDEWDASMDGIIEAAFQHFKSSEQASEREKRMLQASEL